MIKARNKARDALIAGRRHRFARASKFRSTDHLQKTIRQPASS
jgi:hypothetical protein